MLPTRAIVRFSDAFAAVRSEMRVLLDTDAFCKLAAGRVIEDAVQLLGVGVSECGRLPARLVRLPTYSDGAIQHPRGVEGFDPRRMQVSASVRYTVPEYWLLIKGESTRFNPPSRQFPALATQLVYGHLRLHYQGAEHCEGCASTKAAADGAVGLGSAEVWRRLGTIHHITMVVKELEALPWP